MIIVSHTIQTQLKDSEKINVQNYIVKIVRKMFLSKHYEVSHGVVNELNTSTLFDSDLDSWEEQEITINN